jgi:hypothetical protein
MSGEPPNEKNEIAFNAESTPRTVVKNVKSWFARTVHTYIPEFK